MLDHISGLRLSDVTPYLKAKGWSKVIHPNENILVYEGPKDDHGDSIQLVLPRNDDFADFPRRIEELIHTLSLIYEKDEKEIVQEIRSHDKDVLLLRLLSPHINGSISLNQSAEFIGELRNFVVYTACHEESPRKYFVKSTAVGKKVADQISLGHTFHGSFGFTIESPLPLRSKARDISLSNADTHPMNRRVMRRIFRGVAYIKKSIEEGEIDHLTSNYMNAFNANMCESMLRLLEYSNLSDMECSFIWSPIWELDEWIEKSSKIKISANAKEVLESVARELKDEYHAQTVKIHGYIVQLQLKETPDERAHEKTPTIVIRGMTETGQEVSVRVELTYEDYRKACDAHRDQRKICIHGTLDKSGKFLLMKQPCDFHVLDMETLI